MTKPILIAERLLPFGGGNTWLLCAVSLPGCMLSSLPGTTRLALLGPQYDLGVSPCFSVTTVMLGPVLTPRREQDQAPSENSFV